MPTVRAILGGEPGDVAVSGDTKKEEGKIRITYARVSSAKQKPDLERQIATLRDRYPNHELVTDVASGINFRRKGLRSVLERVLRGMVAEVVVTHRDRIARIGVELLEFVFSQAGARFVVLGGGPDGDSAHELADDLVAITTVFVARHNGLQSAENKREHERKRKREDERERGGDEECRPPAAKKKQTDAPTGKGAKDPHLSDHGTEDDD